MNQAVQFESRRLFSKKDKSPSILFSLSHYYTAQLSIHKAEKPSVRPSVMLLTRLGLPTSTYQLPNIINLSSSYLKFVTASECGAQITFCSRLKTKKWRKLEQHSIKNHSRMAQWVEQLTCKQEVAGSNPAGEQFYFEDQYFLHTRFLKFSFDNTVTWHYKHASKRNLNEIEHTSSGNSKMLIAN